MHKNIDRNLIIILYSRDITGETTGGRVQLDIRRERHLLTY